MRTIESLQENECIQINDEKEAKAIWGLAFKPYTVFGYPYYLSNKGCNFYGYNKEVPEHYIKIPASEFMQPSIEDRLEALERDVKELKDSLPQLSDIRELLPNQSIGTPYNNILVDFENVESNLEVGKWYWDGKSKYLVFIYSIINDRALIYGFNMNGNWMDKQELYIKHLERSIPATYKEVEVALINEAKRRGFVEGVVYRSPIDLNHNLKGNGVVGTIESSLTDGNIGIYSGSVWILHNAKWATIIEKPKEIDFSKAGQLVVNENGYVWRTLGEHTKDMFKAFYIGHETDKLFDEGLISNQCVKSAFTLLDKPITISN